LEGRKRAREDMNLTKYNEEKRIINKKKKEKETIDQLILLQIE
jgi:hypothetical protein